MTCPACGSELREVTQSGLTVDVCAKGCGGIWFDTHELQKVDEAHEAGGEALLDVGPNRSVPAARAATRRCPKCPDVVMQRHYVTARKEIEVDECAGCGGVWLDAGELAAIRSQFQTEQERKQAFDEHFSKLFSEQLAAQAAQSEAEAARAKKFAHAFRFICPSYWIPGKQRGAAF